MDEKLCLPFFGNYLVFLSLYSEFGGELFVFSLFLLYLLIFRLYIMNRKGLERKMPWHISRYFRGVCLEISAEKCLEKPSV
jgi:hypothetical protein